MTYEHIISLFEHTGVAAAIWLAIRFDIKLLHLKLQDHSRRIRHLEHSQRHS